MFSTHDYTWVTPKKGFAQFAVFVATILSVVYAAKLTYPDRPAYPREFEGGLEKELGGSGARRASFDDAYIFDEGVTDKMHRQELQVTQSHSRMQWTLTEQVPHRRIDHKMQHVDQYMKISQAHWVIDWWCGLTIPVAADLGEAYGDFAGGRFLGYQEGLCYRCVVSTKR